MSAAVMAAVDARLAAVWTHCPIETPNARGWVAPAASAYLAVEYPFATEAAASIGAPGANRTREEGAVRFVLKIPIGLGYVPYASWMDDLRSAFRNVVVAGVTFTDAAPPLPAPVEGKWAELSFAVAYEFDLFA